MKEQFMYYLYGAVIIFFIFYIVCLKKKKKQEDKFDKNEKFPYILNKTILSPAEFLFYNRLKEYFSVNYIILSKTSLKDILHVNKDVGNDYMKYFNKISRKHLDLLVCSSHTSEPLFGIELDDSSHNRKDRKERDIFVDKVYNAAGLKIIHVTAKGDYTKEYLDSLFTISNENKILETDKTSII